MDETFGTRFFSEEQITALVLIERHGLMDAKVISEKFDIDPARFANWREMFRNWMPFHAPSIYWQEIELKRLQSWLPRHLRSGRGDAAINPPPIFSEEQITAMVGLITFDLATPDEVSQRFCVPKEKLLRWWTSQFPRAPDDAEELCRLENENRKLRALLRMHGIPIAFGAL